MTCTKCKSNNEENINEEPKMFWGNFVHNGICPIYLQKMKCLDCNHIFEQFIYDIDDILIEVCK